MLSSFFVKYRVEPRWIRTLVDILTLERDAELLSERLENEWAAFVTSTRKVDNPPGPRELGRPKPTAPA
jgi:hypothetical protein